MSIESITPFAKAIEEFVLETSQQEEGKKSVFYREVLTEINSGTVRRDSLEENARCARRLAEFIESLQRSHKRSKVMRLGDRLQPLLDGLSKYIGVSDVLIQAGPSASMLIYGGARLVLQIAQEFYGQFDAIVSIMEDVGHNLQCYDLYSRAYKSSDEVRGLLVQSYKHIIGFWLDVTKALTRKKYKMLGLSIVKKVDQEWQNCKNALDKDRQRMSDLTKALEVVLRQKKDEKDESQVAMLTRQNNVKQVAAWIRSSHRDKDLDHISLASTHASDRHEATCEWIFRQPLYKAWLSGKGGALVLTGPPGVGKTMWSSSILQSLEAQGLKAACFFFSFNDPERNDPLIAFRCIALNLLQHYDYVPNRIQQLYDADVKQHFVEMHDIKTARLVIRALTKHISRIHIIIDGLDECVGKKLEDLLMALDDLLTSEPYGGIVKWLFTSRPNEDILRRLRDRSAQVLEVSKEDSLSDIRLYIEENVKKRLQWNCKDCIRTLVVKSQGNFMWTRQTLMILEDEDFTWEDEDAHELENLPDGLSKCYMRSLQHLKTRSKKQRRLARNLFTIIVAAEQPLRLSEVHQALKVMGMSERNPNDSYPERRTMSDIIKNLCSGLVSFDSTRTDGDDPLLVFGHKSIQDFFVEDSKALNAEVFDEPLFKTIDDAKCELGLACIRHLSCEQYSCPENIEDIIHDPKSQFYKHAAIFWFRYLEDGCQTEECFESIKKFILSPSFWTCMAAQSHIAPYLFSRYVEITKGLFKLEAIGTSDQNRSDVHFAVTIPSWFKEYNDSSRQIFGQLLSFVKQWHPVLNTYSAGLDQCIMDEQWKACHPSHRPSQSRRLSVTSLVHEQQNNQTTRLIAPTHVMAVECSPDRQVFATSCQRQMIPDGFAINPIRWTFENGASTRDELSTSSCTVGQPCLSIALPLLANSYVDSFRGGPLLSLTDFKLEDELGTLVFDQSLIPRYCRSAKQSQERWNMTHCSAAGCVLDVQARKMTTAIYGNFEVNEKDEAVDMISDSGYSDSDSDIDSDSDPLDSSTDMKPSSHNRCLLLLPPSNAHIWSTWAGKCPFGDTRCAIDPAEKFAIWSPLPYEARIASFETGKVESFSIPEPAQVEWSSASTICKEFRFSASGEIVYYLLYTAESTTFGIRQRLAAAAYSFTTDADGPNLVLVSPFRCLETSCLGNPRTSLMLCSWTVDQVYVALPPLFCNPKIVRLSLKDLVDTKPQSSSANASFSTLCDQIYVPASTPDRNPKFTVFDTDGTEEIFLTLDSETPTSLDNVPVAHQSPLQPASVYHWTLEGSISSTWREWDAQQDSKTIEYTSREESYKRLRGNYVDSAQMFTVPIHSGLDQRRQAFVSCA